MTPVVTHDVTETAFPEATQRAWRAPAVRSHACVRLTPGRLYLSHGDPEPTTVIELADITRLRLELEANTLTIETATAPTPFTVTFATATDGDDVYTRLWRRLGPAVELRPFRPDFWTAAREPIGVMAGVLLATATLALGAEAAADAPATAANWTHLISAVDWRWVCAIGGAVLAVAQVWLIRRLTTPPTRLELVRRPNHP